MHLVSSFSLTELVPDCKLLYETTLLKPRDQLTGVWFWFRICRPLRLSVTALNTSCQQTALVGLALVRTEKLLLSWSFQVSRLGFVFVFLSCSGLPGMLTLPSYTFQGCPCCRTSVLPLKLWNPKAFVPLLVERGWKEAGSGRGRWPALSIALTCRWTRGPRS